MKKDFSEQDGARELMHTFSGNTRAYAVQHYENGNQWYEAIREPVTESIIESHLNGKMTVGVYPLNFDMVNFATIDIDVDDIDDDNQWAAAKLFVTSVYIKASFDRDITLLLEDTGHRGFHLYAFFAEPIQAKLARRLMKLLIGEVSDKKQDGLTVEIFPKQDSARDLGNPVKLPLGIHQKTKRRSTIIDCTCKPIEASIDAIINCPQVDLATIEKILDEYPEPDPHTHYNNDSMTISGYDEEGDPGLAVEQCAFLNAQQDHPQQPYDAWVGALSIVLPFGEAGTEWAHKLSESYDYYTPEETDNKIASLRADGMSPWSCATIRDRFGKCPDDCILEPLGDSEPSPVRFCYKVEDGTASLCIVSPEPSQSREAANLDFANLLPPDGFIKDYLDYASPLTEAPKIFHLSLALTILSTVVNRKIYIPFGGTSIKPNLWMVLIAPTSFYRKSTAISIGIDLLRDLCPELLLPNDFSREAFIGVLEQYPVGLLVHYEFQTLLQILGLSYMPGTKALLTELYDCPTKFTRKLKKETLILENPFLSLIAATTSEWLTTNTENREVQSGFLARCMFVPVYSKEKVLIFPPPANLTLKQKLLAQLEEISSVSGEVDLSLIKAQHEDYVLNLRGSISDSDVTMAGFISRLEINLLKIAALIEVSCSGQPVISPESYLIASRIIDHLADCLKKHVMKDLMATKDERLLEKIKAYIVKNPGCSRKKILQNYKVTADKAWKLVNLLEESGEIVIVVKGKGKFHYPAGHHDIPKDPEGGICPESCSPESNEKVLVEELLDPEGSEW